jgi:hypothetical protein
MYVDGTTGTPLRATTRDVKPLGSMRPFESGGFSGP